jgi:integrase
MSREDYGSGSIRERSPGHWQVTIAVGRDPSTGRRRRERFTVRGTRSDAQRAKRERLQERDRGLAVAPNKITVREWLTSWLARHHAEGHIGPRAHDRYGGIVKCHLIPALGALRLQELRPDHIADAKARWLSGKGSTAAQPLSGATVHKHLVVLRRALSEAVKGGIIARNPLDTVSAPSVKAKMERRALTEEEIAALLAAAQGTRYDIPIRFTLASGLREGELLGLAWEDVDFDGATINVRQALRYVAGKADFGPPKSERSRRVVELSAATINLLRAHRREQAEHRLKLGTLWQDRGLVFPSLIGTPWLARPFYRGYRAVVKRAHIEDREMVNWHTLRHTAGSQWLRHGADVFSVSRRLGHASAAFTMDVYGHLLKGQQRQAAEALDYLLARG